MSVPIQRQDDPEPPYERCFSCRTPTIFWTNLPDRKPGDQVACCPGCACDHKPSEVPTKAEWWQRESSQIKRF
jgi:hypothetical protein